MAASSNRATPARLVFRSVQIFDDSYIFPLRLMGFADLVEIPSHDLNNALNGNA
jgi:hypothetical protein